MVTRPGNPREENSLPPGHWQSPDQFWVPTFLVPWTPFWQSFSTGIRGLVRKPPPPDALLYPAADYWRDALVADWFPRIGLLRSVASHVLVIGLVVLLHLVAFHGVRGPRLRDPNDLSHYELSPYLPPIRSASAKAKRAQQGKPAFAPQTITSTPPESDNTEQTVVLPNHLRSTRTLPLPNMVALDTPVPAAPDMPNVGSSRSMNAPRDLVVAPPPELAQLQDRRTVPAVDSPAPVAPAPDLKAISQRPKLALPSDIVAPPPEVKTLTSRQTRSLPSESVVPPPPDPIKLARSSAANIAPTLTADAPKLAVQPQQAVAAPAPAAPAAPTASATAQTAATSGPAKASGSASGAGAPAPPAGSAPPAGAQNMSAQNMSAPVVALSLHPDASSKTPPESNRRGTFSATPSGKPDAPGIPDLHASPDGKDAGAGTAGNAAGAGDGAAARNLPPGISVGIPPAGAATSPVAGGNSKADFKSLTPSVRQTIAGAGLTPLPPPAPEATPDDDAKKSELEKRFFPGRRTYTMAVNTPNLNSAGGSWVFHFAELKGESGGAKVLAPAVLSKSDPKYPSELQRRRMEGLVTLFATIHADGHVSDVRIVDGVFPELDEFAKEALERWKFLPAQKNGTPVAVEALVTVPFKARRAF